MIRWLTWAGVWLRRLAVPALSLVVAAYFAYHGLHGERGLMAWRDLRGEVAEAEARLAELRSERAALEERVALMRSDGVSADMLGKLARGELGYLHPHEIVVPVEDPDPDTGQ